MAINYAELMGGIIKIGIQKGDKFTRERQYEYELEQYALVYGQKPIQIKNIWLKQELSYIDALSLESWVKQELRPHLACGTEWFRNNPEVRKFIFLDPLDLWTKAGRPRIITSRRCAAYKERRKILSAWEIGTVCPIPEEKPIEPLTPLQEMEGHIAATHRRYGDMSQNQCRRLAHPERMQGVWHFNFISGHRNLRNAGKLIEVGRTQRSAIYHLAV